MSAEDFFSRWSKRKAETHSNTQMTGPLRDSGASSRSPVGPAAPTPPPTLEDVSHLTADSDYSAFVGREVDASVKRSALKKLFSHPQINVMDRLDIYIDDYTQFTPLTPQMLSSLEHAKDLLMPQRVREQVANRVIENAAESELPPRLTRAEKREDEDAHDGEGHDDAAQPIEVAETDDTQSPHGAHTDMPVAPSSAGEENDLPKDAE